jgi:hypothetical protein
MERQPTIIAESENSITPTSATPICVKPKTTTFYQHSKSQKDYGGFEPSSEPFTKRSRFDNSGIQSLLDIKFPAVHDN